MGHVVLLGDSIFDNGVYVAPAPDVVRQLRAELGHGWRATLLAVDGDVVSGVRSRQLQRLPADATHLVVSAGGNDALRESGVLTHRAEYVADAVGLLAQAQNRFRLEYELMAASVAGRGLPAAVCTIYDANYPEPQRTLVVAGLSLFNDVITRAAFARGLGVLDLRLICDHPGDYANPIEPSAQGGKKIARAIAAFVEGAAPAAGVWV